MKSTILVIEDEEVIRENIAEILEYEDMRVLRASNGDAGIKLAREFIPDLIICDIRMPGKDGYSVLLDLQRDSITSDIPFIFLTAKADRASLRHGMALGADDYLTKPFMHTELINAVYARLEKKARLTEKYTHEAEDLRQSLLRTLPHELRTPLVGIIGGAEMLLMENAMLDSRQITRMANLILSSSRRLYRSIENYLLFADLEIVKLDPVRLEALRRATTNRTAEIIRDVSVSKAAAYQREQDLKISVQDGIIFISSDNLKKVVEEVVDNAFKFSQSGTAVNVTAEIYEDTFVFQVSDLGQGMSTEQITKVNAFVQFGRERYEQQGIGLGLAIARRIVELHGGELLIQSEVQQGTRVRVKLSA